MSRRFSMVVLATIALTVFISLTESLHSGNKCTKIAENHLDCSNLGLIAFPSDLPRNTLYLDLSNNRIKEMRKRDLTSNHKLQYLNLRSNKINEIERGAFCDITNLKEADLSSNNITDATLGCNNSVQVSSIERLHIQNNSYHIKGVNFSAFEKLTFLSLDVRKNFKFDYQLRSLTRLKTLKLFSRQHVRIQNDSFEGLIDLPISQLALHFANHIQRPIAIDYLRPFTKVKFIQIEFGGLFTTIKDTLRSLWGLEGRQINSLNMGSNYIITGMTQELNERDLKPLSKICVKNINLSKNFITKISTFVLWNSTFSNCVEKVDMSGNLFRMNDYLVFLYMANMPKIKKINIANIPLYEEEEEKYGTMHRGSNLEAQKSTFFPTRTLQNKETQRKTTKYNITLHLSDSLETVDSHGIHTDFGLPRGSKVYIKARGLKRVNMGDMDMDVCVFKDPVECINSSFKIFDMSGWKCSGLNPTFLSKSKCFLNLVTLNARNSDLGKGLISDKDVRFLRGLRHLKKVDLSRNDLSRLHDNFFHDQRKSLQKVNLTNNNFDRIPPAIWKLQNLKALGLKKNSIQSFTREERDLISRRKNLVIDLDENLFACSCDNLATLKWMAIYNSSFSDTKAIKCRNMEENITVHEILVDLRQFELKCIEEMVLNITASLLCLMILIICGAAIGLKYKYLIKFHYLRLKGMLTGNASQDFENNIFLSFANIAGEVSIDENWIWQFLNPYLSNELKLRVYSDWHFDYGSDYFNDVHTYMGNCRKIIIVLSKKFLKWEKSTCHMEMARNHAFYSKRISLVVIFFDDLTTTDLPKCLVTVWFKTKFLFWPSDGSFEEERRQFRHKLMVTLND